MPVGEAAASAKAAVARWQQTRSAADLAAAEQAVRDAGRAVHDEAAAAVTVQWDQQRIDTATAALARLNDARAVVSGNLQDWRGRQWTAPRGSEVHQLAEQMVSSCYEQLKEMDTQIAALTAAATGSDADTTAVAHAYRDAYRQVLSAQRPMGGVKLQVHAKSSPAAVRAVQAAAEFMPAEWAERSNEQQQQVGQPPLYIRLSTARAHYSGRRHAAAGEKVEQRNGGTYVFEDSDEYESGPAASRLKRGERWVPGEISLVTRRKHVVGRGWVAEDVPARLWSRVRTVSAKAVVAELTVSGIDTGEGPGTRFRVASHEFSHRVEEQHPTIGPLCQEFRRRRSTNEDGLQQKLESVTPGSRTEVGWPDHFVARYVGRTYDGTNHTEVLSMGMEALLSGTHGGLAGRALNTPADLEHRDLVLGLLAVA